MMSSQPQMLDLQELAVRYDPETTDLKYRTVSAWLDQSVCCVSPVKTDDLLGFPSCMEKEIQKVNQPSGWVTEV